jgi:hypothetical protein
MLAAIVIAVAALMGLGLYTIIGMPEPVRGSAGPLVQSSPGRDPPPLLMRPKKAP